MRFTVITRSRICAMLRPVTPSTTCRHRKPIAPFRKFQQFMEKYMKRPTGLQRPYLASSLSEETLAANSEQQLHSVLATLEQCRTVLHGAAARETALLVSMAILQLRMKLNR